MTVRELVKQIQVEIRDTDLQPARAAELLTKLTALLGNCFEEIREADHAYALVLLACLESEAKANRAKIRAETSPEYRRKREARDTRDLVQELIGSLKYLLRSAEAEMRLAR
jgi:hypothetical protein